MNNVLVVFLIIFVALLLLQRILLRETEAFAASQGGALLQLQTSRPYYYLIAERP
jgi:hypothetical protein